jgi:hypothetical protein
MRPLKSHFPVHALTTFDDHLPKWNYRAVPDFT